ncbi:uncharacterized protein LOC117111453 [Anneissia japonica]|uniref:uncharacterized protein LOC117111453 n=1 Tax=Anneissia japonica TaxID=1529436 RepID=UPI001425A4A3|nr:uncharacterized protein LOC117111453 [Anneissia japonica]
MLYSIGIICLTLVLPAQGTPSFGSVSIGSTIIVEGGDADLNCPVVNLTDDYSISWYRETITGDRTVIYRDGVLINNDLGREAEAYTLHSESDVRIKQVRGRDLGHLLNGNNYNCEVTHKSTGSSVTISCYSELGYPSVQLQWSKNGEDIENLTTIPIHSYIYLNYTFILKSDDLESSFSCTNGIQSCNLSTEQACAPQSSSTITFWTDKKTSPPDPGMQPASSEIGLPIVIGASIGAVLFLAFCLFIVVIFYRRRNTKQRPNITYQQSTDEGRNQNKSTRSEFTIDNASNNEYAQVTKRPKHQYQQDTHNMPHVATKALNEESVIVENYIYDGI